MRPGVLQGNVSSLSQRDTCPLPAGCSRGLYVEPGRPLPEPSTHTTQGTGTHGKTCGQDPGVWPTPAPQEEEQNSAVFSAEISATALSSGFTDPHSVGSVGFGAVGTSVVGGSVGAVGTPLSERNAARFGNCRSAHFSADENLTTAPDDITDRE